MISGNQVMWVCGVLAGLASLVSCSSGDDDDAATGGIGASGGVNTGGTSGGNAGRGQVSQGGQAAGNGSGGRGVEAGSSGGQGVDSGSGGQSAERGIGGTSGKGGGTSGGTAGRLGSGGRPAGCSNSDSLQANQTLAEFCAHEACPSLDTALKSGTLSTSSTRTTGCGIVQVFISYGPGGKSYYYDANETLIAATKSDDVPTPPCNSYVYTGGTIPEKCADADTCVLDKYSAQWEFPRCDEAGGAGGAGGAQP